jgi:hypothetical protein
MAKNRKLGGRHASIGCDRFIQVAARGALTTLGGVRIHFNAVIGKSSKSHPRGTWALRKAPPSAGGGILVVLYGDPCAVEACVFRPANDNKPAK